MRVGDSGCASETSRCSMRGRARKSRVRPGRRASSAHQRLGGTVPTRHPTGGFRIERRPKFDPGCPFTGIVNGAPGGRAASLISNPNATVWTVMDQRLAAQGLTPEQS